MAFAAVLSPGQVIEDTPAPQSQEWEQNLNNGMICPDCRMNPPELDHNFQTGDFVCMNCGLVLGQRLVDNRSEWRTFSNDENGGDDPSRVGKAESALDAGGPLETDISFGDGGAKSKDLHRAHNRMTDDKMKKNLHNHFMEIQQVAQQLNLMDSTIEYTKLLFKEVYTDRMLKGKNQEALRAACVMVGARQMGNQVSFKEVNNIAKVPKKDIGRIFKILNVQIKHKPVLQTKKEDGNPASNGTTTSPEELCMRVGAKMMMSPKVTNAAKQIAERQKVLGSLAGRSPLSAAAASMYMSSHLFGEGRPPKECGEEAGVSDSTCRHAYKELFKEKEKLIDKDWLKPEDKDDPVGQIRGGKMERLPAA